MTKRYSALNQTVLAPSPEMIDSPAWTWYLLGMPHSPGTRRCPESEQGQQEAPACATLYTIDQKQGMEVRMGVERKSGKRLTFRAKKCISAVNCDTVFLYKKRGTSAVMCIQKAHGGKGSIQYMRGGYPRLLASQQHCQDSTMPGRRT